MRLVLLSTLCIIVSLYGNERNDKLINPLTREIYYRYYLIKRCEQSVNILINHTKIWASIRFNHLSTENIEHSAIQAHLMAIKETHSLQPFLLLWEQMNAHRSVIDSSFHKDFIKLLFMLYAALEMPGHRKEALEVYQNNSFTFSIEKMLNSIDKNIDNLHLSSSFQKPKDQKYIEYKQVTTDDIALNYYLIQRLDKAIQALSTAEQKDSQLFYSFRDTQENSWSTPESYFTHERINDCFSQIVLQKNLIPLLHMWQEFIHFRHAGDSHFLKEMLMMLFTVYKDLLFTKLQQESETIITTEMNTILDLYEHVDELPLDEILNAIDLTTDKLTLLQNIEKKTTDWKLEKYPIVFHTLLALPLAYFLIKTCPL